MPPRAVPTHLQQDIDYAFFVHPSEGPNSLTVCPKLNGTLLGIVLCNAHWGRSTIHIHVLQDLNPNAWERCNHLVQSWIINYVSDSIAYAIVFYDYTFEVWQDLHERFSKIDHIRIVMLRSSINNLKQGPKYVIDYFTELKALWEEFSSHVPFQIAFVLIHVVVKLLELLRIIEMKIRQCNFLIGLNANFLVVETQILLLDPLSSLNKVYSLMIQEESNTYFIVPMSVSDDNLVQMKASDARKSQTRDKSYFMLVLQNLA